MKKEGMIQTGIRMKATLLDKLRLKARKEHVSLNTYMVSALERGAGLEWPVIDRNSFKIDSDLASFGTRRHVTEMAKDAAKHDPRAAYLLSKYGNE